jgi:hypothetical protein
VSGPLSPSPALLCKLASIAVHAEEMSSPDGHEFDRIALQSALGDQEVVEWVAGMTAMGMAPVKRK